MQTEKMNDYIVYILRKKGIRCTKYGVGMELIKFINDLDKKLRVFAFEDGLCEGTLPCCCFDVVSLLGSECG